jgi:hypothetical protein
MTIMKALKSFSARKAGEIDGTYPLGDVPAVIEGNEYKVVARSRKNYKLDGIEWARYPAHAFERIEKK